MGAACGQVMKSMKAMKLNPMKARKSPKHKSKTKVRKAVVKQTDRTSGVFQKGWSRIPADKPMPPFAVWNGKRFRFYDLKLPKTEPLDLTCVRASGHNVIVFCFLEVLVVFMHWLG